MRLIEKLNTSQRPSVSFVQFSPRCSKLFQGHDSATSARVLLQKVHFERLLLWYAEITLLTSMTGQMASS